MSERALYQPNRREFVKRSLAFGLAIPVVTLADASCEGQTRPKSPQHIVGGGCDGCDLMFEGMPRQLDWQTTIARASELGERLEMSGAIYKVDGKTPAPDVVLYV